MKRGVDCEGCGPIGLRGHRIMLCYGVRPPSGDSRGARNWGWSQGRSDYEMPELGSDDLILGFGLRTLTQDTQKHDKPLKFWLGVLDPFYLEGHEFMFCFVFLRPVSVVNLVPRGTQVPYSAAIDLVAGSGVSQVRVQRDVTLIVILLREIVPERHPIPLIDLSDSETVEGPAAQGVKPGVSIEEDPSEAKSDAGMLPELDGATPVATKGIDTLVLSGSYPRYQYRLFVAIVYGVSSRWRLQVSIR
ncbi:hypothetical protein M9H77_13434 [Catharanthus roseus]|uniref:Uncharacterized protein n=1 Tax=Catharanthus roseus TaxID=4058 RepID=A0ACC0BK26_CATRO|nr:hypothetical protein M9H77_13434 [Catharanthus roseus]